MASTISPTAPSGAVEEFPPLADVLADDPLAQWKAYYSLMASAVPGIAGMEGCAFQFVNPERPADSWKDATSTALRDVIDARPIATGPFYGPSAEAISQNYYMYLLSINAPDNPILKRAIERFEKAEAEGQLKMRIDGDLAQDYQDWNSGLGNPLDISITKNTRVDNKWQIVASGDLGIMGFTISGKGTVLDQEIVDDKYQFSIKYDAIKAYQVTRDSSWWNGGLIEAFKNAEFSAPFTQRTFFDPNSGSLALVPTSLVVAYRAQLALTVSNTFYKTYQMDLEGSGQISIGPFKLNANAHYVKSDTTSREDRVTISYRGSANPVHYGSFSETHVV